MNDDPSRVFEWLSRAGLYTALLLALPLDAQVQPASVSGVWVASGSGGSFAPVFSLDGRFVAFVSHANNLVTNDDLGLHLDVFVRDLVEHCTALVSVNSSGVGGGDGNSNLPSVSSDGRFIAFESVASNLAGPDTNRVLDVFVRDMAAGTTRLVSLATDGTRSGNGPSSNPSITPDGRWVVFESAASDLVPDDTNGIADVVVRDLHNAVTRLVSAGAKPGIPTKVGGETVLTGRSDSASITPDGRFIVFVSTATNLVRGVTNTAGEIYLRDLHSNVTRHVSAQAPNFIWTGSTSVPARPVRSIQPVITSGGRYVAYHAPHTHDDAPLVLLLRFDALTDSTILVAERAASALSPQMSLDGNSIAYDDGTNVFVWSRQSRSRLVSMNRAGTGGGNRPSHTPVMTPDGGKVVFLSAATNLVTGAHNGVSQVYVRDLASGTTRLVSATPSGGPSSADIDVTLPAISADGRCIAFENQADDLVAGDFNRASDVFVRDLEADSTGLVSQRDSERGAATGVGLCFVQPRAMSADGRVVAFLSFDNNLAAGDTNAVPDAFVRDLASGRNYWLSVAPRSTNAPLYAQPTPGLSADGRYAVFVQREWPADLVWRLDLVTGSTDRIEFPSRYPLPAISGDGQLVAFQGSSHASNFVSGISQGAGQTNVFLRDFAAGTYDVISLNRLGTAMGNGNSGEPLFSPDGRWLLFTSTATDLTTNETGGLRSLFARELATRTTLLVSIGPDASRSQGYFQGAVFSGDSRFVAWMSPTPAVLQSYHVFLTDLLSRTSILACVGCEKPSVSGDGRLVAYETRPSTETPFRQVWVKDVRSGVLELASVSRTGALGTGDSVTPQMSPDGRFVVFASKASDLVENDTNAVSDIFVRDRLLGTTLLASASIHGGGSGNSGSTQPLMSADGRTVIFQSMASDLVEGDYNDKLDVFVLRLGVGDSDNDGLDDDWEAAYFGDLSRDGDGDFDGDGHTERQEFLAGTDPTNTGSILRVLTVTALSGGTTVLWSSVPGKSYRVQFKDSLDAATWSELTGVVTADSATASAFDAGAGSAAQRFYRVVLVP
jgi:Tol biopolymer transport system component